MPKSRDISVIRHAAVIGALALLAACGQPETPEGALTADEEQQLNEAAAMLDQPSNETAAAGAKE